MSPSACDVAEFKLAGHDEIPTTKIEMKTVSDWVEEESPFMKIIRENNEKGTPIVLQFDSCGCNACHLKQFRALMGIFVQGYTEDNLPSNHTKRCLKKLATKWGMKKLDSAIGPLENKKFRGGDSDEDL